jgi:ABC-type phosphate/phosphonate transport system permease subunit
MPGAMKGSRHVNHARREMIAVAQGQTKTHTHLRRRLLTIFLATAFISLISTLVVYFTERHVKGGEIHNLFDAFLFSTSQLLTASSVANPKTNFGKVLELFFDIWAITVVATLAGSFGAFFHARSKEMDGEMDRVERRLEGEVEALRERL